MTLNHNFSNNRFTGKISLSKVHETLCAADLRKITFLGIDVVSCRAGRIIHLYMDGVEIVDLI